MVSSMDRSIGVLLNTVKDLGIEKDTLIVFTSDNGPEDGRGTTNGYKGNTSTLLSNYSYSCHNLIYD